MNGNVLIIEDEDAIVNVLTSMLIANEYMPVVAKDGNQAMMLLRSFQPDVILCHHLYFLAALVRQLCPNIPVYGQCHGSDLRQIRKNSWPPSISGPWVVWRPFPRKKRFLLLFWHFRRYFCCFCSGVL